MPWEFSLSLDPDTKVPLFLQIAGGIREGIRQGRLRRGDRIPGSREVARALEVHRNTVLAALQELEAEGWIVTTPAVGTFVSPTLPDAAPRPFTAPTTERGNSLGFELPEGPKEPHYAPVAPGVLQMGGGAPDVRLIPVEAIARAYRRSLKLEGRSVLNYGDPRGHQKLRAALAGMLAARRGLTASPENLLVTRGSQMAVDLVARALIRPGDVVLVEALGYRPAWEALRNAGAKLLPIPLDHGGIRMDAVKAACAEHRVRALYLTPHHQFPTTVTMEAGRRLSLLELARTQGIAILEDDYDHEFHYEGRPIMPLASADQAGVVVYMGTLSKILAPGLRLGFIHAPKPLIERLAAIRMHVDRQGDLAMEGAVAQLLEDGEVLRHARRVRRIFQNRRDALVEALRKHFGEDLGFEVPAGGMALWVHAPGVEVEGWIARSLELGVAMQGGRRFAFEADSLPYLRLGFAALTEAELRDAVARMARAL